MTAFSVVSITSVIVWVAALFIYALQQPAGARVVSGLLLVPLYAVAVLGLGIYWWYYQQRTARFFGMCIGLIPTVWLIVRAISL